MRQKRTQAPSIAAGGRSPRRHGVQRAAASPAPCSHRTQAGSPAGDGATGARLASHAGGVTSGRRRHRRAARVTRRHGRRGAMASPARSSRLAGALSACWRESRSGAALAGRRSQITRARGGGHSISSSWESMSKRVAHGCFSGDSGLFYVGRQPHCTTGGQVDPPGCTGASGALLRTPWAVRPLAACKVRALPSHGQAGNSGRGAGGAAARRGRIWGACRRGRALQKM